MLQFPTTNHRYWLLTIFIKKVIFEVVVFSGLTRVCGDETPLRQLIGLLIVMDYSEALDIVRRLELDVIY